MCVASIAKSLNNYQPLQQEGKTELNINLPSQAQSKDVWSKCRKWLDAIKDFCWISFCGVDAKKLKVVAFCNYNKKKKKFYVFESF